MPGKPILISQSYPPSVVEHCSSRSACTAPVLEVSCTSCHTDNPAAAGKHRKTGKAIQPLAPAANPERLTDLAKVEKWFKRNCSDVLEGECTALEKGDVIAYLLSVK